MVEIIINIFTLLGGLAFFLYGMDVMSTGLKKMAGGKLENSLKKLTAKLSVSIILGAGITVAIQSSSALTVMLVGLVNSGIMQLEQTIGVIMGGNIGTTLTAWITSLTGISSDSFMKLLKPDSFSPLVAFIGILLIMLSTKTRKKDIGSICLGFAILMYGMILMSASMKFVAEADGFENFIGLFNINIWGPIIGFLIGTIFTGIIQSSAASIAILQALSISCCVTYNMAIPIVLGLNIGTCATALISAIGVSKNAKRVAAVHIYMKAIGAVVCMILFYGINAVVKFPFLDMQTNPWDIALIHTIFNIINTIMFIPFQKQTYALAKKTIKDGKAKEDFAFIDERLFINPPFAINECRNMTVKMAHIAKENILASMNMLSNFDQKKADLIVENEEKLDHYEDSLGTYLVKLSGKELSDADSRAISLLLHTISDFERIGDHACNILKSAEEKHRKQIEFSDEAKNEVGVIINAITEILEITIKSFDENDVEYATNIEPLEQVIDELISKTKYRHIKRLQTGKCTIELGFILTDVLTCFERVSDHCSNIGASIIQIDEDAYERHDYLNLVKSSGQPEFIEKFNEFDNRFRLN